MYHISSQWINVSWYFVNFILVYYESVMSVNIISLYHESIMNICESIMNVCESIWMYSNVVWMYLNAIWIFLNVIWICLNVIWICLNVICLCLNVIPLVFYERYGSFPRRCVSVNSRFVSSFWLIVFLLDFCQKFILGLILTPEIVVIEILYQHVWEKSIDL